jgi:hypothetical protein
VTVPGRLPASQPHEADIPLRAPASLLEPEAQGSTNAEGAQSRRQECLLRARMSKSVRGREETLGPGLSQREGSGQAAAISARLLVSRRLSQREAPGQAAAILARGSWSGCGYLSEKPALGEKPEIAL